MPMDVEEPLDDAAVGEADRDEGFWQTLSSTYLMPYAMATAGGCHLLHSVSVETFDGMHNWDTFLHQLQALDKVFMVHYRRDRLNNL